MAARGWRLARTATRSWKCCRKSAHCAAPRLISRTESEPLRSRLKLNQSHEGLFMIDKISRIRKVMNLVDRRTMLGRGAAAVGGLFAAQFLRPKPAEAAQAKPAGPAPDVFTVTGVGEMMVSRPFAM